VAHYLVSSILVPLEDPSVPGRELRVAGSTGSWKNLIDTLGEVQGVTYTYTSLDPSEAAKEEEKARLAGDIGNELGWSAKPLATTGGALVGPLENGKVVLDNDKFNFVPETPKETFERMYPAKK
jgi:hypothetical protein